MRWKGQKLCMWPLWSVSSVTELGREKRIWMKQRRVPGQEKHRLQSLFVAEFHRRFKHNSLLSGPASHLNMISLECESSLSLSLSLSHTHTHTQTHTHIHTHTNKISLSLSLSHTHTQISLSLSSSSSSSILTLTAPHTACWAFKSSLRELWMVRESWGFSLTRTCHAPVTRASERELHVVINNLRYCS